MSEWITDLNRVLRYSMDTVTNLLEQLASDAHKETRWGHGDHTFRKIAADALDEAGRSKEADRLRDSESHIVLLPSRHTGKLHVQPARFNYQPVASAFRSLHTAVQDATGRDLDDFSYGLYHSPDTSNDAYRRVWLSGAGPDDAPTSVHVSELGKVFADDAEQDLRREGAADHPKVQEALHKLRTATYEEIDHLHPSKAMPEVKE